jgi:hypothetical protein
MERDDSPTMPAGTGPCLPAVLDEKETTEAAHLTVSSAIPHSSSTSSLTLVSASDGNVSSDETPLLKRIDSTQSPTPDLKSVPPTVPDKTPRRPKKGWRSYPPFNIEERNSRTSKRDWIAWSELTLREKYQYRRDCLLEYFSETKKCLPYVKRLFVTVYGLSPWRATLLLLLNLVNGFLPALTLQTQGSFLILV